MRVLVCGGRNYRDHQRVAAVLDKLHRDAGITTVIQGGAKGADELAFAWAYANGVQNEQYDADWENFGTMAGPIRNKRMLQEGRPDVVIAFPGGKGTANMVALASKFGVEVVKIAEA